MKVDSNLCTIVCSDDSRHEIVSPIRGSIIEVNTALKERPALLQSEVYNDTIMVTVITMTCACSTLIGKVGSGLYWCPRRSWKAQESCYVMCKALHQHYIIIQPCVASTPPSSPLAPRPLVASLPCIHNEEEKVNKQFRKFTVNNEVFLLNRITQ